MIDFNDGGSSSSSSRRLRMLKPRLWRRTVNALICISLGLILFGYVRKTLHFFPITIEAICNIFLAETNRRKSKSRLRKVRSSNTDTEKGSPILFPPVQYLASVVGYREELGLFEKCLRSYQGCPGLAMLLVGIDGNEAQDLEMANVARKAFPGQTEYIGLDEPLADLAVQLSHEYIERELKLSDQLDMLADWTFDDLPMELREAAASFAMDRVYAEAVTILQKHHLLYNSDGCTFRVICVHQPHISKKGIMFTNLVFATILGHANRVPYLWTSDSDTWVTPTTLSETIGCMDLDPAVGGTSSSLGIHNANENVITTLGSAIYWSELAITRGQTGAVDAVDCQPGPCAAFRLSALSPNLFEWYTQSSLGIKTVVNEDRHLTTRLLLDGWKVTFNTETIAYTDTPTTLVRWILQQIRWARANQIETFQYPAMYAIHHPILFLTAMHRFYGPLCAMFLVIRYVLTGSTLGRYSVYDFLGRVILCATYNYLRDWRHGCNLLILASAQIFYQLPLPGIIMYASTTAWEGGWGTSMRNRNELQKARSAGWNHFTSISVIILWMGIVAAALARWFGSTVCPTWILPMMFSAATCMMVTLYCVLLRRPGQSA